MAMQYRRLGNTGLRVWRSGNGETLESLNPADGTLAGLVYVATAQDVDDAVRGGAWRCGKR